MSRLDRPFIAALLLALAALVQLSYVYAYTFTDESDTLLAGYLISRGAVLYRDIFSHHFPFAYHWVALVIAIFGRSIFAVRVSVIAFQLGCLAMAAWLTRFHLAVGLTALAWAFVGYLYFGNMALYQSFTAPAVLVVFVTALGAVARGVAVGQRAAVGVGILAAIALLADPFSVYPVALSFLAMRLTGVRIGRMAAATALPLGGYALYLLATGSALDFYADAIAFNTDVYSRFSGTSALPVAAFGAKLVRGLGVVDARWLADGFTLTAPSPGDADHWLFTGFLLRAGVVLLALALLLGRRPLAAGFVYVVAAALQATSGDEGFRAMPFVMVALFSAVTFVLGLADGAAGGRTIRVTRGLVGSALLGLVIAMAVSLVGKRESLSYEANFGAHERKVRAIRSLTCDRADVAYGAFPADPLPNFLGDMPPVSRHLFLLPWNAPAGVPEVIANLRVRDAVVDVKTDGTIWGLFKARDFLGPLIVFLDSSYERVEPGRYVSRTLRSRCPGPGTGPR